MNATPRQEILLNVDAKETRFAHLKNGQLADLVIERKKIQGQSGNIYFGKVTNILHNIQSAFIDIGQGENGFIHIGDILQNTKKFEEMFDMEFSSTNDKKDPEEKDITKILKPKQTVLVQVIKEAMGSKGARLTSNLSIAGRYLVLLPNAPHRGVSRKIEDPKSRARIKKLLKLFELPQGIGLICRTAGVNATPEMLIEEATQLVHTWETIVEDFQQAKQPGLLYQETNIMKKAVTTAVDKKMDRILVDDHEVFNQLKHLYSAYAKEHPLKIEMYRDKVPMFERFNVESSIDRATKRKIFLPSGGYLFMDRTEAMYTIDVNSGRSSNKKEESLEEAIVKINFEAAEEISRQLKIRNIGGLVICDFIDMRFHKNKKRVLNRLREVMREDTAKVTILGMSEFGLVEMTRQRSRESLEQTLFDTCPYCSGLGKIKSTQTVLIDIGRHIRKAVNMHNQFGLKITMHPQVFKQLVAEDKEYLQEIADSLNAKIEFDTSDTLHLNDFQIFSTISNELIEV